MLFITFFDFSDSFGEIKIGDNIIRRNDSNKIELKPEKDKLYFVYNNDQSVNKFEIDYKILIEETCFLKCKITLKINECYPSCKGCTLDIIKSNNTHHNCIYCDLV